VSVACNYPSFIVITTVTTCNKDTVMCYQCSLKLSQICILPGTIKDGMVV